MLEMCTRAFKTEVQTQQQIVEIRNEQEECALRKYWNSQREIGDITWRKNLTTMNKIQR